MTPRFSIITPCLDRAAFIEQAVRSVLAQGRADVEHLIIDGGSTDGTLARLQAFPELRITSEPDAGIYDALNRGLARARGEFIGFLNSDDTYAPGAFEGVLPEFSAGIEAVGGAAAFDDLRDGARVEAAYFRPAGGTLLEHATLGAPAFNAWFFRRAVFTRLGGFDDRMRIAGDRDFMLRLAVSRLPVRRIDTLVYRYLRHPGSLTFSAGGSFERIVHEHLLMGDKLLARSDLPAEARELIARMRRRETLDLAARSLRGGRAGTLLRIAAAATRRDPGWPWWLARRAWRHVRKAGQADSPAALR
jgi:glycosyltransferase involved in cell wall biosynthesis